MHALPEGAAVKLLAVSQTQVWVALSIIKFYTEEQVVQTVAEAHSKQPTRVQSYG